jgi:antitoxin component YwqK of YwqJK toxin-antitoxin module
MKLNIISIVVFLAVTSIATGQVSTDINKTDQQGRKQGQWIKKYPNGNIQYEGIFMDDHPVGEFKRYYEDKTIKSILIYSSDGKEADARIYHPNGFIASSGKYINQMKEGKWKFFSPSVNGYLISEEEYSKNIRDGLSLKFFPDSTIAEKVRFVNDVKEGEWLQYHQNGKLFLRSNYKAGMLNGKFEVWYQDGKPEFSGAYKNNLREGTWHIYNDDGTLRYDLNYVSGVTNDQKMKLDATNFIDSLENNKRKVADPEKTGVLR